MTVPSRQLIEEAILINHRAVSSAKTLDRYRDHLLHFVAYLGDAHAVDLLGAKRKHVLLFMAHLEGRGGATPDPVRVACSWCRDRGYPDGRDGPGWSASYRKSYLSAIKFVYFHCFHEDELPDANPAAGILAPKVVCVPGYTPSADEIQAFLQAKGRPRDRLLAHWMFYAPSRRQTFADARWQDIDLDRGTWSLVGKNDKPDVYDLHPALIRELRLYRRWQLDQAVRRPALQDALSDPDTAYVLLTCNGRPMRPSTLSKMVKWRAARAGIAVVPTAAKHDAPQGQTSRMHPHALRRGWADHALNHPTHPVPIDVVSEVLHHADISTTRKHYARTKPERARAALRGVRL